MQKKEYKKHIAYKYKWSATWAINPEQGQNPQACVCIYIKININKYTYFTCINIYIYILKDLTSKFKIC